MNIKKRLKRNKWWIIGSILWFLFFGTIAVYMYESELRQAWDMSYGKSTIKYLSTHPRPHDLTPPSALSPLQQSLKDLYGEEFETIMEAAKANDCTKPELLSILFAIRTAENGREGIEFGVLNPKAVDQPNSLRVQAGWCAATISKNHKRWIDSREDVDFITFLGNRYCPVGADNDPNGLNKH